MVVVLGGLAPCGNSAKAQRPGSNLVEPEQWHFRYELFQMLLEQNGLKPADPQDVMNQPRKSVIVKLGNPVSFPAPQYLEIFCRNGGRVLFATDTGYSAGRICDFNVAPVEAVELPDRYQKHGDCVRISNLSSSSPLTKGVSSVVLNRSGWIDVHAAAAASWNIVATLPNNCRPRVSSGQPVLMMNDNWGYRDGLMVVAADPSLLTNGMLWHGDNAILAINISQLLAAEGRSQLMFMVDTVAQASYEDSPLLNNPQQDIPPLPDTVPEAKLDTMLRVMNSVAKNVQESNVVNEALANRPRNLRAAYFKRWIFFALGLLALLIVIWRLSANGPTLHPGMPNRSMKSAHEMAVEQKTRASELGLSASILARDFCRELTDSTDPTVWHRTLSENAASGTSLIREKSLQKRLTPLVSLAVNTRTVHISRARFEALGRAIVELRALHEQGQLLKQPVTR